MMIIWSGLGFLVPVIIFGFLLLAEFATEAIFHDDNYYQSHGWPKLVACFAAAVIVGPLGRYLNSRKGRVLIDPATGKEVVYKPGHTFFFIPIEYWWIILLVLGVILLFVKE